MTAKLLKNLVLRNSIKTLASLGRIWLYRVTGHKPSFLPEIYYGSISHDEVLIFRPPKDPLVTIIIPAHNKWEHTHACLYSILCNTDTIPYEVILADDMSTDETRNILKHVKGIRTIRNDKNLGFLLTSNMAAQAAIGKYLLFINNDTNVQKGWLTSLIETLELDEKVGMAGPCLVNPDGSLQSAGGIVWDDGSCWIFGRDDDPGKRQYTFSREVDYLTGACFLIRRDLWQGIGGFDERFSPAYYEDTDLAMEVRKRGYKTMYQPQSIVVHFEGISYGTDSQSESQHLQKLNKIKFLQKWSDILKKEYAKPGTIRATRRPVKDNGDRLSRSNI